MPKKTSRPFDWQTFETTMLQQIPLLPKDFPASGHRQQPSWVSELTEKLLANEFSAASPADRSFGLFPFARGMRNYRAFETHRSMIIRIPVPSGVTSDQIDTTVNPHQVKIRFAKDKQRVIPLAKPILPDKTKALLRNGILELRMPKSRRGNGDMPIHVREE